MKRYLASVPRYYRGDAVKVKVKIPPDGAIWHSSGIIIDIKTRYDANNMAYHTYAIRTNAPVYTYDDIQEEDITLISREKKLEEYDY